MPIQWSLQDAKNKFSAVVDAAQRGEPQMVTKRGKAAVVVLSAQEFRRLQHLETMQAPSFREHLLAIPDSGESDDDGLFERADIRLRDAGLAPGRDSSQ